jgi:hypothetical protein
LLLLWVAAKAQGCDQRRPVTDQAAHAMATEKPRPIVTYVHRPKRQPRKKAQATGITGPTI